MFGFVWKKAVAKSCLIVELGHYAVPTSSFLKTMSTYRKNLDDSGRVLWNSQVSELLKQKGLGKVASWSNQEPKLKRSSLVTWPRLPGESMSEFRIRGGINLAKFGIGARPGVPGYLFGIPILPYSCSQVSHWFCMSHTCMLPTATGVADAAASGFKGL